MSDLLVSSAVLSAAVLLSEATRRAAARLLPGRYRIYALEAASTFQLCSCTHELKLLGDSARLEVSVGLTLCFIMTVIHVVTFREATWPVRSPCTLRPCTRTSWTKNFACPSSPRSSPPWCTQVLFNCGFSKTGHTYPEYCLVYWLGPVLGKSFSVALHLTFVCLPHYFPTEILDIMKSAPA
uniref:Uncharacterized protein n=1 Tax=Mola mola TaxID=94237 RepID=A0A3Q3WNF9_MOLML